ncbi:MAG: HlyD family efflux transporter periplasmic adaptor subunit, partial [Sphingobacteriales bacterium]
QILSILVNTASYDQVEQIALLCDQLDTASNFRKTALEIEFPAAFSLGDLQGQYIALMQAVQEYQFFVVNNSYGGKIGHLSEQNSYQSKLSRELWKRDSRLNEQLNIQRQRFLTDSALVAEQVMSKIEYENARKDLLSQQMNSESNYANILQSRLQGQEIQKNISETAIEFQTKENTIQQKIRETVKQFNGAYSQWQQNYVLRSPVAGSVSFFKFWKENQFVQAGEAVMVISPTVSSYVARGELSIRGAGKVKSGQRVLIKLAAYPYEEYGSLNGTLQSRSTVAMDSTFALDIRLDRRLITNAGQVIPDQPQLFGVAEIITENKSVLERLFEQLYGKRRK